MRKDVEATATGEPPSGMPGPPVTAEALRTLFDQHRVVRAGKLPSAQGFTDLAHAINTLRFRRFIGQWFRDLQRQPIRVMADALPLDEVRTDALDTATFGAGRILHRRLAAMEVAAVASAQAGAVPDGWYGLSAAFPQTWHHFAPWLAERFRAAMRTTNPEVRLGASDGGPIARFMAAVIPMITGETPKGSAITRYLQRR